MLRNYYLRCAVTAITVFSVGLSPLTVHANPAGGQVVGGSASIQGQGTANVTVNQATDRAIINWQSFNIGAGETTRFNQPSASSIALNRVTGDKNPSQIMGTLTANGRVFLVNPEGFIFGANSKINTAGFLATTNDIANEDFMAGKYDFKIPGNPHASIINKGAITVSDMGMAALVAPSVRNEGIIAANMGKVALSASNGFSLDFYGDNLINFALNDEVAGQILDAETGEPVKNIVENKGTLSANGGTVVMSASTARAVVDSVINNSGVIEAQTVGLQDGKIILSAQTAETKTADAPEQKVVVSGTLDASGKDAGETGSKIQITGENIALKNAKLDASGDAGGGKVLVGGDYHGGKPLPAMLAQYNIVMESTAIPTATKVTVDGDSFITASAMTNGDGGKVVFWSDGTLDFAGTIRAGGGNYSGNGGFVETSGYHSLVINNADVMAPTFFGNPGTWLLDPLDLQIDAAVAASLENALNSGTSVNPWAEYGLAIVSDIIKSSGGDATLVFTGEQVAMAGGKKILSGAGRLNIQFNALDGVWLGADRVDGEGTIELGPQVIITTNGGNITLVGPHRVLLNGIIDAGSGNINIQTPRSNFTDGFWLEEELPRLGVWLFDSRIYANTFTKNVSPEDYHPGTAQIFRTSPEIIPSISNLYTDILQKKFVEYLSTSLDVISLPKEVNDRLHAGGKDSKNIDEMLSIIKDASKHLSEKQAKALESMVSVAGNISTVMNCLNATNLSIKFASIISTNDGGTYISSINSFIRDATSQLTGKVLSIFVGAIGSLGAVMGPVLGYLAGELGSTLSGLAYDKWAAKSVVLDSAKYFYSHLNGTSFNVLGL